MKRTVIETMVLLVVGISVAAAANGLRRQPLSWTRNHFDMGRGRVVGVAEGSEKPAGGDASSQSAGTGDVAANTVAPDAHLDSPYQQVSVAEAFAIFNDPNTSMGVNLFVDARNEDTYRDGHIPGALQVDHYYLDDYVDILLEHAEVAEKIVVYCNGGECTDSILMCTDLVDLGIPIDNIYLFAAGWTGWTAANHPVARGDE